MRLIPKEEKFFDLFEELVDKIEEGITLFLDMLNHYDTFDVRLVKLKEVEHEADMITHRTYEKLHKTFLTPLDREDIYALVNKMDSVLDLTEASAVRMSLFKIKKPAPELFQQARILRDAIGKLKKMVHGLRDMKNSKMILDACVEINTLENEGDTLLRKMMGNLFENEKDPIELIKCKEIFERFEEAIDVCEDVSNIAEGIVLKHA
jgi:predicted phosphate transport protein (TIGR00153 family)